jgi:hypothetical protein
MALMLAIINCYNTCQMKKTLKRKSYEVSAFQEKKMDNQPCHENYMQGNRATMADAGTGREGSGSIPGNTFKQH